MKLDKRCFKIDKTNAKAMIDGYKKNGILNRQSIWCDVTTKPFPMLITLNRTRTKFPMSVTGEQLRSDNYSILYKYIAFLDSEFFIRNDIKMWEIICNNGLFDIWKPSAPYMRFEESKSDPKTFRIQLIRIFKIKEEFKEEEIYYASDRIDHLISWDKSVTIDRPVINDNDFQNIKSLLVKSVQDFKH